MKLLQSALLGAAVSAMAFACAQKPELTGEVATGLNDAMQFEVQFGTLLPSVGYVEYGAAADYGQRTPEQAALEGQHVHVLEGLEPGTRYHYRTVLRDWSGQETVSQDATLTTPPLVAPETLTLSVSVDEARLSWVPTFGAARYAVKRAAQAGGPYKVVGRTAEPSYTETVPGGKTFFYVVSALAGAAQASGDSAEVSSAADPALVDDSFAGGLDETVWSVYNNSETGQLTAEGGQLTIRDVGNGTDYGQLGLVLKEALDLTSAPTTITVEYAELGNTEQNPGFWNAPDLSGDDTYNHPGVRATVSPEGLTPTVTPPAEGAFTPGDTVAAAGPYTLTWTITPPKGEGEYGSTMQVDGEEVYSGTLAPGSFDPAAAYFYLHASSPDETGTTVIESVTVTQGGSGGSLPSSATAAWLFDEGDGETVADAVGESDGTFTGAQWAEGRFGSAAQIAPGKNFVSVPWTEALSPEGALTVTAWVYLNEYGEGEFPNRRILQLGSYDPKSEYGIEDNSYRLLFEFGDFIFDAGPGADPEQLAVAQDEYITLETWHHVAGVYSGDAMTLYIDGEEVATQPANGAALVAPEDARLFIGTKSDKAPEGDWWDGLIDEVAVFNRALSQADIQGVMQGLGATTSSASTQAAAPAGGDPAIVRAESPIIDGDLSEWSGAGTITVPSTLITDVPDVDDDSDLSVTVNVAYDDDRVYIGADVKDDALVFERSGEAIWDGDALEFWLGAQQFGVALVDESPYLHAWGEIDTSAAEVALTLSDGGYTVEVALPRSALGEADIFFDPGSSVPVAVGANDADEEGSARVGQIYYPEGWTWGEPNTFAPLTVTE